MIEKYLIIDKKVLPDYFEKVVEAKLLVGDGYDVSKAVKEVGNVEKPAKLEGRNMAMFLGPI